MSVADPASSDWLLARVEDFCEIVLMNLAPDLMFCVTACGTFPFTTKSTGVNLKSNLVGKCLALMVAGVAKWQTHRT